MFWVVGFWDGERGGRGGGGDEECSVGEESTLGVVTFNVLLFNVGLFCAVISIEWPEVWTALEKTSSTDLIRTISKRKEKNS